MTTTPSHSQDADMPHVPGTSIASPSQPDGTSQHRPVEVAASTRQTSLLHYFKPLAKTVADEAETRASVPVEVASSPCSMALDIASTPTATPQAERVSTHYKLWDFAANIPAPTAASASDVYCELPSGNAERWKLIRDTLAPASDDMSVDMFVRIVQEMHVALHKQGRISVEGLDYFLGDLSDKESPYDWLNEKDDDFVSNDPPEAEELYARLWFIMKSALRMPELFPDARVPVLRKGADAALTLSASQICCLLAAAVFGLLPQVDGCQDVGFHPMFGPASTERESTAYQKLECLLHYFEVQCDQMRCGHEDHRTVTFHRKYRHQGDFPAWSQSTNTFGDAALHVFPVGTIEDDSPGYTQLDFANRMIGGGVLRSGAVQEEILFMICPELLISLLFTEELGDDECLFIKGAQRYSNYRGYASTFRYDGHYVEEKDMTTDPHGRLEREILALDALMYPRGRGMSTLARQYHPAKLKRELNKAFIGFSGSDYARVTGGKGVATGNWGCGAFNGDLQLKAVLQLMAAAEAGIDMAYFTFSDRRFFSPDALLDDAPDTMHPLRALFDEVLKGQSVGTVYRILLSYRNDVLEREEEDSDFVDLFTYLRMRVGREKSAA